MKFINFLTTPIKVSYRERSEYTKLDKVVLTPVFMFFLVVFVTWQAWEVSRPQPQDLQGDTALSNAMIYFEKGDFDNAELQLSMIIEDYKGTEPANYAKFYLGRIAFVSNDLKEASRLLEESVKKLGYPNLKTEAYIMLAQIEEDLCGAMSLFNSAEKYATSTPEKNYISILKAKRMINDKNKDGALEILDNITLESSVYKEIFEHTYGMAYALNDAEKTQKCEDNSSNLWIWIIIAVTLSIVIRFFWKKMIEAAEINNE
tara:strand:- start:1430 stop:2209 length:780 start_codon:yes stop_codon:yes gene_type:complete